MNTVQHSLGAEWQYKFKAIANHAAVLPAFAKLVCIT
jgi:hypothetical protein